MKPVVATLQRLGIHSILYLDDMLIMASSKEEARSHLAIAVKLLDALGFIINRKKSTFSPTQQSEFLWFILKSQEMTTALPAQKLHSLRKSERDVLSKTNNCEGVGPASRHDGGCSPSSSASPIAGTWKEPRQRHSEEA